MKTKILMFSILIITVVFLIGCTKIEEVDSNEAIMCTADWNPVCGVDGKTYSNECMANTIEIAHIGECEDNLNLQTESNTIPLECTSWFDGCNTCFVSEGQIGGCTKKFCENTQTPKCLEYKIPENCTSWFDGCNSCAVDNGKASVCTLMYCETPTEPKCLKYKN